VCSAVSSGGGWFIEVNAIVPGQPDAPITFTAVPTTPTNEDAATALGLVSTAGSTTLAGPTTVNVAHYALGTGNAPLAEETLSTPAAPMDGLPGATQLMGDPLAQSGIYALSKVAFNLLCIPDAVRASAGNPTVLDSNNTSLNPVEVYSAAIALCDQCRAMLLIDPPPNVTTVAAAVDWKSSTIGVVNPNGAAFWPRLRLADPLNNSQLRTFAPSGLVAGVYANTDTTRGVWKAPAGIGAVLNGVQNMGYQMSDAENGVLNPLGLNCFRTFPVYGPVLWGARTLVGADAEASQWKYVPIRRVALFLESSLYQGTQWVVFEPNDEPLWSAIRLNIGSFMQNLFIQGYFQGQTPDQAYFVKCDSETTTQTDIDNGVVNIVVGFAPLYPAEFVVIQIQQMTGQTSS
jgi:phage tail sheath protein FI